MLRHSVAIFAVIVAMGIYSNGWRFWADWHPQGILAGLIFVPFGAAVMWLRWDWAPHQAKQRNKD
jgi:hypothetical protein